jgi:hypothetical protein
MKTLFSVTMIVELVFALGFMAVPDTLMGTFGASLDPVGIALSRIFGAALLAFVTLAYYARRSESMDFQKGAVRSLFVYWLFSTVFMLFAQLAGLFNPMGWSTVVMHLGFLIWTGVFAFRK